MKDRETILQIVDAEHRGICRELQHKLYGCAQCILWNIEELEHRATILRSRVLCIVDEAGRGKTNIMCDFVERVLQPRTQLCIYLTGRDLRSASTRLEVEQHIYSTVFGSAGYNNIATALDDASILCERSGMPLILIVDGANEHKNPGQFSASLESLLNELQKYSYIRVIITCRTEYFDRRFGNLKNAAFADRIAYVAELGQQMKEHKHYMLTTYFDYFNIEPSHLGRIAKDALTDDPFLLRIFCETYGNPDSQTLIVLPPIEDIFLDELFRKYNAIVVDRMADLDGTIAPKTEYSRLMKRLATMMLESNHYASLPIAELDKDLLPVLEMLVSESIILRKDLAETTGSITDETEVVSFTYDVFRDYVLANHLVLTVARKQLEQFVKVFTSQVSPDSPIAEGLGKFSYLIARRENLRDVLQIIDTCPVADVIFANSIFCVPEDRLENADVERVEKVFLTTPEVTTRIFRSLALRRRTSVCPRLNVTLLPQLIRSLNEAGYASLAEIFGWPPTTEIANIDAITRYCVRCASTDIEPSVKSAFLEILVLLLPIDKRGFVAKALEDAAKRGKSSAFVDAVLKYSTQATPIAADSVWRYLTSADIPVDHLDCLEREAEASRKVKTAVKALDAKVTAKYKELTEQEVVSLVVDDKWLATLAADVQSELDRISQALTGRIKELAERYDMPLPVICDEVEALSAKVDVHLKKMGLSWN